jgi:hypothetical protein
MSNNNNHLMSQLAIGAPRRKPVNNINPAGRPQMKATITNKSGADIIQYSEDTRVMPEGQNLGFAGAPDMSIGPDIAGLNNHDYNTAKDGHLTPSKDEDGFVTKMGNRASDLTRDDNLYRVDGIEVDMQTAAKLGLVVKTAIGWVEVDR